MRPSGERTAAGPASTAREPGTPMPALKRVTERRTGGRRRGRPRASTAASAAAAVANSNHGRSVRARARDGTRVGTAHAPRTRRPAAASARAKPWPRRCREGAAAGRARGTARSAHERQPAFVFRKRPERDRLPEHGGHRVRDVFAAEKPLPRQHLVKHDAKRPDIRALVDGPAPRLLRRHVRGGPENHADPGHGRRGDGRRAPPDRPRADGSIAFAKPKSSTFTVPSGRTFTFAGFKSRWMIPCSWADFERLGDLPVRWAALRRAESAPGDPIRERRALDRLHDEGVLRRSILRARGWPRCRGGSGSQGLRLRAGSARADRVPAPPMAAAS